MTKDQFLMRMHFPIEWSRWDMYPQELFDIQIKSYKPGNENAA
jgi:hypothetical protein